MNERHEWKHEISYADLIAIRSRLQAIAQPDPHARNGTYDIRSLYFDTLQDRALREKLDGVSRREKFRIRCYNLDYSLIHLEKKSKRGGLGAKESCSLTLDEVALLLCGETKWMRRHPAGLVRELGHKMTVQGLRPRTIVDYTREPFLYGPGNVRVTLDYNLRTALHCTDFLNPSCITLPPQQHPILLEVKWDAYLPSVIRDAVQLPCRRTSSFSKYAACRVYG